MTILCEKRGRCYIPVADDRKWNNWPHGFHIVYTPPYGGHSIRFKINPDRAELLAAIKERELDLRNEIEECFKLHPYKRELTKKEIAAWKAFEAATGNPYCIERESIMGVIDRIIAVLTKD